VIKVGLTGGIACGKSIVRRHFESQGVATLDADEIVHDLLGPDTEVTRAVADTFGDVLAPDGSVDRKALGAIVFSDEAARRKLNAIVHPGVWRAIDAFFKRAEESGEPLAVVDAALMIETGSHERYDVMVIVACSEDVQLERLMARDGLSTSEAHRRISSQMPIAEKRSYGDFVIDTSGSFHRTIDRADQVLAELRALAGKRRPSST
jgi:dephospho-CoA kinase